MTGHSGSEPPDASETVFVADVDYDFMRLDVPLQITKSDRVATAVLKTTRYVGQVDTLGFLTQGDVDVKSKQLAGTMELTIHARIVPQEGVKLGPTGVELEVYLHRGVPGRERSLGKPSGLLPSAWQDIVADVNTVDWRFPDDPGVGKEITSRSNEISFVFTGTGRLTIEIDWMTLTPAKDDLQGLACRPVLLLHGWRGNSDQMGRVWTPGLTNKDIPSWAPNLTSEGSIQNNAIEIQGYVADMKDRFGVAKVNIVGFGKGGIDAREHVRSNDDVETLVMLASPNGGSFAAGIHWGPVAKHRRRSGTRVSDTTQMTQDYMNDYNLSFPMNTHMNYETVAAAYDSWAASVFKLKYGDNDEEVSQESVETNIPAPKTGITNKARYATSTADPESQVCAQQQLTNHKCLPTNLSILDGVTEMILGVVLPPSGESLRRSPRLPPEHVGTPRVGSVGQNPSQGVSSETATVPPDGVTHSHTVLIDAVDQATFYGFADGDFLSLELVSPTGTRIDATTASTDPAVGYAPLMDAEPFWYSTYQIESPETGLWTIDVTGTGAPSPDSAYGVAAFVQASPALGVSMTAELDPGGRVVGDEVRVTVTLTSAGEPVTDATVTAEVGQPDGTDGAAITLSPNSTATDGTYGGTFTASPLPGTYLVIVSAEGSVPAFSRQQGLLVNVAPSATAFSGMFSDHGVDIDGDGRYDQLAIDVGVEVDVGADYRVFGTLMDGSGATLEQVRVVQQLDPGPQTVSLLFDGARLFDLGVDGPYVLDDLAIEDLATLTGLSRGSAYTTAGYSHDEFERPVCLLTGNTSDHGVNADPGDQLPYEELVVEVELDTLVAADVQAVATLSAEDGTFVTATQTFASLAAGPNMLAFYFLAPNIYSAGKAGPYSLVLLNVWEPFAQAPSVSLRAPDVVAVTQPYALEDFAPSPVYTVGGTVSGLDGEGLELTDFDSLASVEPGNGPFTFGRPLSVGSAYDVRVTTQPMNPMQVCSIVNGKGTVGPGGVTDIAVECVTTVTEAGLDPTFGDEGKVTAHQAGATAIALQGDGSDGSDEMIVLLGDRTLTRYDSGGNLDGSFGLGGVINNVLGSSSFAVAKSVAIQSDGKIVVAGYTMSDPQLMNYDFALARYTVDGTLDPDFAGGNIVMTDFAGYTDYGRCVLVQSDDMIVVAGLAVGGAPLRESEVGVARYTQDGTLDPTFGSGGKVMTPIPGASGSAVSAALQSDGKIVVLAAVDWGDESPDIGLVRYTVDGLPDPDFGDGGIVRAGFAGPQPTGLAVQSDDSIVVVGCEGGPFAVACFDGAGHPVTGFGGGLVTTPFPGGEAAAQAVAIQDGGSIVVAGYTASSSSDDFAGEDFALARYTATGELDDHFGDHGQLTLDFFADSDQANCLAIQPLDGKIVVAGSASRGTLLGLARLLP